jgi:hypothetical protein
MATSTTLTVSLTPAMQDELSQPGVFAYEVHFSGTDPTADAVWTQLNPNFTAASTTNIGLLYPFDSGKVYLVVESTSGSTPDLFSGGSGTANTGAIQKEGDLNEVNAQQYDFLYDSFELTLHGAGKLAAADAGNLTEINGFGLPMEVEAYYSGGTTATVGYNISGSQIESEISDINTNNKYTYNFTSGALASGGDLRLAVSPGTSTSGATPPIPIPFSPTDWQGYVTSLESYSNSHQIILTGEFNGAPDGGYWHNGGYFAYQLSWDSQTNGGVFWLTPVSGSQIQGAIQITPENLEDSIYDTLGSATIYTSSGGTVPFSGGGLSSGGAMGVTANNQWGIVDRQLIVGLDGGFIENEGVSSNSLIPGNIDFDDSYNWDPTSAYTSISSPIITPGTQTYDPYAAIFASNTNAYGFPYSDALTANYASGGPLIPLYDPGSGADVSSITLTLFAATNQAATSNPSSTTI